MTGTIGIGKYGAAIALSAGLLFTGCDTLFGSSGNSATPKPASLHPEIDAFADTAARSFSWIEGYTSGSRVNTQRQIAFKAVRAGTSVVNDTGYLLLTFISGETLPASVVSGIGFNTALVKVDTAAVPDPGAAAAFPELPYVGWRAEWTAGEVRLVRKLVGTSVQKWGSRSVDCWAFAETTYVSGQTLSTGTAWVGYRGLVRRRTEWASYQASADTAAAPSTLWREIQAL